MRRLERLVLHTLWIATGLRILIPSSVDPDLWGHLLFGKLLLDRGVPATTELAYTAPGQPWIDHELVAEAAMARVYDALGPAGLVALKTVLGMTALALVWRSARRRSHASWAAATATTIAAVVMAPGLMIRPQLFTLVGLALTLEVLTATRHRATGAAWLLPLVVVVWINTHGGVLAGIGVTALALATAALQRPRADGSAAQRRARDGGAAEDHARYRGAVARAVLLVGLVAAATLVNPYGWRLPWFLLTEVTPRVPITEWAPVALADASFPLFKAVLLVLGAWLVLARRARLPEVAIAAAAAAAALLHQRHIPLFAIAAAPLLAAMLVDLAARLRLHRTAPHAASLLRLGIGAGAALQIALAAAAIAHGGGRIDVDPLRYPVQALRFLAQNGVSGRVALPFDWGEFALWALPPGSSVAVDGRFTTAYPQRVLDEAWRFMRGDAGWDDLLVRYPTDIVVSARQQPPAWLLREDPAWQYVYSDPVSVVFIRRVPSQAATLARFAAGDVAFDGAPLDVAFPALPPGTALAAAAEPSPGIATDVARSGTAADVPRRGPSSATLARAWTGP